MYIQKLLAVIFVAAFVGAGTVEAQKPDTDIQAKARALLHQREAELDALNGKTPAPPEVAPAPNAPTGVAPGTVPPTAHAPEPEATVPVAQPPVPEPAPAVQQSVPAPAPVTLAPGITVVTTPAAQPPPTAPAVAVPSVSSPESDEVAQKLLAKRKAEEAKQEAEEIAAKQEEAKLLARQQKAAEAAARAAEKKAAADAKAAEKEARKNAQLASNRPPTDIPQPVPANMVPGSKQARLYDLLQRYRRDEITPAEYHQARAKILEEP